MDIDEIQAHLVEQIAQLRASYVEKLVSTRDTDEANILRGRILNLDTCRALVADLRKTILAAEDAAKPLVLQSNGRPLTLTARRPS